MSNKLQSKPGRPRKCRNCKLPKTVCACGRPTKFTEEALDKLYAAYSIGADHKTAAHHAKISISTLHGWLQENSHLRDLVEGWRQRPTLRAYNKVFESLATDVNSAWRWLERKDPELAPTQRHKHGGDNHPDNKPIKIERIIVEVPEDYVHDESTAELQPAAPQATLPS